jgi:hypothetical protein
MPMPKIAMIQVRNIHPLLIQRSGPTMHITGEYAEAVRRARLGEKRGKWKVISGIDGMEYQTRDMVAGTGAGYLTKDSFTLTKEDIYGPKGND